MAITYTQAKVALDEIAQRSETNRKRLLQAKATIDQAVSDLTAMQSAYASVVGDIDAAATANPDDTAWQSAKAEKDNLVADFQAVKSAADADKAALEA